MKHEWRKAEKTLYLPKAKPQLIDVPEQTFIVISGKGNPNSKYFSDCIGALYGLAYTTKMALKKMAAPPVGYVDWTVYPLEGIWDIADCAKPNQGGKINKDDLVFDLMIRQPDFITEALFEEMRELTKVKKSSPLLNDVKLKKLTDGKCVQMLHVGSYDDEPASFAVMEAFTKEKSRVRKSKAHREIYLSDFRKVEPAKLKTVLRFQVSD